MYLLLLIVILSYLIGSIPNSMLITRYVKGIDIRQHGSGNAGGTNVWRVIGWKYGLLVILLDALKGILAVVLIARLHYGNFPFNNLTPFDDFTLVQLIAGSAAVLGHIWSVFADFKGGKGIATGMGILIVIVTVDLLVALGVFFIVVAISRYVSLGSMLATVSIPLTMIIRENVFNAHVSGYYTLLPFLFILTLIIIFTHRKNIIRLINGNENKISFSKKK
ncbi:MAG TPA: glycerol-3-phosphate 1-O-acyltransferase PlsY [Ignavibacteriaceae bacterium]|jgi:glycerol-3-phosphate acyltransferase PlsY|nr:glycerol-3-phosphate 1-O-acyltransferase PlsY [Ignavibacteriaceae bacterium]